MPGAACGADHMTAVLAYQLAWWPDGRGLRFPAGRRVAVGNAVRLAAPPSAAFLAELAGLRRLGFGRAALTEVQVVRTDRLLSPEGTQLVERVRLAGGLPG
jgi:hypothetical protein